MNDNEETRNWSELAAECERLTDEVEDLKTQLFLARATIAEYKRADMDDDFTDDRARVYRTTGKAVEVDEDSCRSFGEYMFLTGFECGKEHIAGPRHYYLDKYEQAIAHAVDKWKERQTKP